ncbi:MAG: hypothetical protein V3W11_01525 [bacterium]
MRIHVVKNAKGEVVAAFERASTESEDVEPELSEGGELGEVDVPDELTELPADDFIARLQADIKAKKLEFKPVKS